MQGKRVEVLSSFTRAPKWIREDDVLGVEDCLAKTVGTLPTLFGDP